MKFSFLIVEIFLLGNVLSLATPKKGILNIFKNNNNYNDLKNVPIPGGAPVEVCDSELKQLLTVNHLEITPLPPVAGANLTISAKGTLSKDIKKGAYVIVDVRYNNLIRLVHQTFDLCEQLENVDRSCPIKSGDQSFKHEVELPQTIPPGNYLVQAQAFTEDDEYISCFVASVRFDATSWFY